MANQWLRLWHDMPNDPKWRTISRISGEPISLVQAMYLHLLVDASRNALRGYVTVTVEDIASALDVTPLQITSIFDAMESRVLENGHLSGWENRQPKREDFSDENSVAKGNAQRQKEYRDRKKQKQEQSVKPEPSKRSNAESQQSNTESHNITLDKDKDKDKDKNTSAFAPPEGVSLKVWADFLKLRKAKKSPITETAIEGIRREADKAGLSLEQAITTCCERGWQGFNSDWTIGKPSLVSNNGIMAGAI